MKSRGLSYPLLVIALLVIVVGIGVGVYYTTQTEPQAKFEVKSLTLSRSEVEKGQSVTAYVEVANTGGAKGSYEVELNLNGKVYDSKMVDIEAKGSRVVEFEVRKQEVGNYNISADDFSKSLEVITPITPAEFEISNLEVEPKEVKPGEPVMISVDVKNTGGKEGSCSVELFVDESLDNSKTVTLENGESQEISFTVRRETSKSYSVGIGGLSETFEVSEGFLFEVKNLTVSPERVAPGDPVLVSAYVKNPSEEKKELPVELKVDGEIEKTENMTLVGGLGMPISFTVKKSIQKSYSVSLDNVSKTFKVVPVVEKKVLYNDSTPTPEDAGNLLWSGAEWGGPAGTFENSYLGENAPEGEKCFKTTSGNNWNDSVNYAGWGTFFAEIPSPEEGITERYSVDLSDYSYLRFWVKTPETLAVEIETLGGEKYETYLEDVGWDGSNTWQEIVVPKSAFGGSNRLKEICGAILITVVAPSVDFYVDNVVWVRVAGGNLTPTAGFTYSPDLPSASEIIQFTNNSLDADGYIESWSWDFGDGETSDEENPSHSYSENGVYTVELTVTDNGGATDSRTQEILIGNQPPSASFTYSPSPPKAGETIQFTENSSDYEGNIESWSWDFGDGETSDEENPSHSYSENGVYTVELTVTDNGGATDSYTWDIPVGIYLENEHWQVTWIEQFVENNINRDAWGFDIGGWGWGNNEWEYHTDRQKNARIEDGNLLIEAHEEDYKGRSYTSARLKTQSKRSWKYGRIEARIKLPYGQGIWPAFWMLGEKFESVGWPSCGEIDIMEMIGGGEGRDDTIHGTIHWQPEDTNYNSVGDKTSLPSGIFADNYHIFTIEWDSEEIRWFLDGEQYFSTSIKEEGKSEFHEKFFIIINIAVGGNWPGYPDETTEFPQRMYVDWVRVSKEV